MAELAREGVHFLGPQVNASVTASTLADLEGERAVRIGFDRIKGLSRRSARGIVDERAAGGEFRSMGELLQRVRLGANEVKALVLCGACDGLAPLDAEGYPIVHEAVLERIFAGDVPAGLEALTWPRPVATDEAERERLRLYQALVRVRNELAYLEMHLAAHPVALLRREAERFGCIDLGRARKAPAGDAVTVVAVLAAMRRVQTRQGVLLFLTLEDETGLLEAVVFPGRYREVGRRATTPGPFLAEGRVRVQQGVPHLEVTELRPFHEREGAYRL